VGDGACASIGSGCTSDECMSLTIGTSAAVRVLAPWPAGSNPPPGLWAYRLDPATALLGGATSNGGIVRDWLRRTLSLPADETVLDALLATRPAAAHGVTMLPFIAGERSPHWPLDATALLAGLRLATSPLDILQAGMEAVAYRVSLLRRLLLDAMPRARTAIASGAALERSPYWAQLVADVLGEPLLLALEPEASSRGAAILGLVTAGLLDSAAAAPPPAYATLEPRAERHQRHVAAMAAATAMEDCAAETACGA
jgi:gluconokinase